MFTWTQQRDKTEGWDRGGRGVTSTVQTEMTWGLNIHNYREITRHRNCQRLFQTERTCVISGEMVGHKDSETCGSWMALLKCWIITAIRGRSTVWWKGLGFETNTTSFIYFWSQTLPILFILFIYFICLFYLLPVYTSAHHLTSLNIGFLLKWRQYLRVFSYSHRSENSMRDILRVKHCN